MTGTMLLSDGYAPAECFPGDALGRIANEVLATRASEALQYGKREGYLPLRQLISDWLESDGISSTPDEVNITTGAKQGIDLTARALATLRDELVAGEPTYMSGLKIFGKADLSVLAMPSDDDGLCVDILESLLSRNSSSGRRLPRFIYEIPDFQNPSGSVLSEERREKLVAVATKYDIPILEDNPYRWLRYDGEPVPSLRSFDRTGIVISLGTFAKFLAPGMRVGWINARPDRLAHLMSFKADAGTSPLTQMIAFRFLSAEGALTEHLSRIRAALRPKRDQMLASLRTHMDRFASWTEPRGGYYVWVTLRSGLDGDSIVAEAARNGMQCYPGSVFYHDKKRHDQIRLSFSYETPERIDRAVALLGTICAQMSDTRPATRS